MVLYRLGCLHSAFNLLKVDWGTEMGEYGLWSDRPGLRHYVQNDDIQYHRVKHLGEPQTLSGVGEPLTTEICVMVSDEH